jgi:hypothetical protein
MFFIIPTNEGDYLNYKHTFKRFRLKEAQLFGEYMRDQLKPILSQGSIGILIQDQSGKETAFLPPTGTKWEKRGKR